MNKLVTFAAAALLTAAAGHASAGTISFTTTSAGAVCNPGPAPNCATAEGSQVGAGQATLVDDGMTAVFTNSLLVAADVNLFGGAVNATADINVKIVKTGTMSGNTLNFTSNTQTFTGCTDTSPVPVLCGQITYYTPVDSGPGSVTFDLSGPGAVTIDGDSTYTLATPLPAAAWLFGSGLIGLAGVARRRRRTA